MEEPAVRITQEHLEGVRSGDDAAHRRFVEILYPLVRGHIRRHLRRQADHDDVSQEIFMRVFLKLDQYVGPQPFEHWVSRIAVRTCYDWLRKLRARPMVHYADLSEKELRVLNETSGGDDSSHLESRREIVTGLLDRLIATLKPREQIVIRFLDLEQKSVAEIQELTGWSASKIKVTAMRARRKLAAQLQTLENRISS